MTNRTIVITSDQFMELTHIVGIFKNRLLDKAEAGNRLCPTERKWLEQGIASYRLLWDKSKYTS